MRVSLKLQVIIEGSQAGGRVCLRGHVKGSHEQGLLVAVQEEGTLLTRCVSWDNISNTCRHRHALNTTEHINHTQSAS